jgi:hypothetical protein
LLLPVRCKREDTICIAIEKINHSLMLAVVDLVTVDPDLEGPLNSRLANLLQEPCDDGHVIVDHDYMRILLANGLNKTLVAEALLRRILKCGCINYIYTCGIGAELRRSLRVALEAEVDEFNPGEA